MKVAIVVFVIGEVYTRSFNLIFRSSLEHYCKKYGYDLIILDRYIKEERNMDKKKFYWQRLLIPDAFKEYDFVVSMDSDIFINADAPALPLNDIPEGKIAAVNERKYFNNYEWREKIQVQQGWEKTGKEWHALSSEYRDYNDHINGGLVIYQPKFHAECMKQLYNDNIDNYMKYHQDDQSILSLYLIDNNMIYWLDERYNRLWFFAKQLFYPNFASLSEETKKQYVKNFIALNYFTHFTSQTDIEYI